MSRAKSYYVDIVFLVSIVSTMTRIEDGFEIKLLETD